MICIYIKKIFWFLIDIILGYPEILLPSHVGYFVFVTVVVVGSVLASFITLVIVLGIVSAIVPFVKMAIFGADFWLLFHLASLLF